MPGEAKKVDSSFVGNGCISQWVNVSALIRPSWNWFVGISRRHIV